MPHGLSSRIGGGGTSPPARSRERYILGHSPQELTRLERQGSLFAAETEMVLRRAGLQKGMRVVDIGCGLGDVALMAASIVGSTGSVVGVDSSPEAVAVAQDRAEAALCHWLHFEVSDLGSPIGAGEFDALIGRFILLHLRDPVSTLRQFQSLLTPNAIVAFLELDIDCAEAVPEMPLLTQCIHWITETYRRDGVEPNMGSRLYAVFREVGMMPTLWGSCRIEVPPGHEVFRFAAETIRSLLPQMDALGVVTADEIEIDTLAERLSAQAIEGDHCIFLPRLVGAWSTLAADRRDPEVR